MKELTTMSFVDFRKNISECVNLAKYKDERFLIKKNNKPVEAFVAIKDLESLKQQANSNVINENGSKIEKSSFFD